MNKKIKKTKYVKFLSKTITLLPFALLIFIILIFVFIILDNLISKLRIISTSENEFLSPIISSISDLLIINGILAIPKIKKRIKDLYMNLENKMYIFSSKLLKDDWIKSKFIYAFNPSKMMAFNSQSYAIKRFISNFKSDENNLFYVTGDSSVGKTSMLILLFEKCADNLEYFKILNNNTIYLCKSNTEKQIKKFVMDYSIGKFKNNYIFIDDIGELSAISQIKLWNEVICPIIESDICKAKALTLVTNENNSIIRNRIVCELDENAYLKIVKSEKKPISISLETISFCKKHIIGNSNLTEWIEILMANRFGKRVLNALFEDDNLPLKTLFICLVIVGKYSKIIDINTIRKIYKKCGYSVITFNKNIKLLVKSNAITFFPFYKNYIFIEQNIIKQLINIYRKNDLYFTIIKIFEDNCIIENDAEKWLIHCECCLLSKKYEFDSVLFSNAFNAGNFDYLLTNLNSLLVAIPNAEKYLSKELGYLNERIGNRNIAIKYLRKHINFTNDVIEKAQSYLLLFEIEHHFNQDTSTIKEIANSTNDFLSLQGKYWLEHLNIERGIFDYDRLLKIVNEYSNISHESNKLNYYHILRRMYSDLARVYFLNGVIDKTKFIGFEKMLKQSELSNHHIEYEDYLNLLTIAHYLHYDVIFQVGFYKYFKHDCDDRYGNNPNIQDVLTEAIKKYEKCENNFKNYGDKAWMTIAIRKNELLLSTNIQQIKIIDELNDLRNIFINNGNDLHLAFVDFVLCKAEFLQYYLNEFELDESETIEKCRMLLEEAKNISRKVSNEYGLFRVKFISAFLTFFENIQKDNKKATEQLKTDLNKLKRKNYYREYEMINYILKSKKIKTDLVCDFFKYYPIVLQ